MKKIFIIFGLLIIGLNSYAQSVTTKDIIKAKEELYVRDTTITDLIEEHTSGTSTGAENGLTKTGSNIGLDGTLIRNTQILGAGYDLDIGTSGSNIGTTEINTNTYTLNTSNYTITQGGKIWVLDGEYFINQTDGDTLAYLSDILSLIEANEQIIPFNIGYTFDPTITDSRPGPGLLRFNNATYSSVTQIFADIFDSDNVDKTNFMSLPDTGSYITVSDGVNYANYQISGAVTAASSYYKYEVTYLNNSGVISGSITASLDLSNNVGGGGGTTDSLFHDDTQTWLANGDTIPKADSTRNTITASDTLKTELIYPVSSDVNIKAVGSVNIGSGAESVNINPNDTISLEAGVINIESTSDNMTLNSGAEAIILQSGSNSVDVSNGSITIPNSLNSDNITSSTSTINIINSSNAIELTNDTLFLTEENIKAKTLSASDSTRHADGTWSKGTTDAQTAIESMSLSQINLDTATYTDHSEGRIWYDESSRTYSFQNDISGFTHNLGENNIRVYNETGSTIGDGLAVRRVGTYSNGSRVPSIALAGNSTKDSSDVIGLTTVSIAPSTYGVVTILGDVSNFNTTPLTENEGYYLGFAGALIDTAPPPPYRSVRLGVCSYSDNDSGSVSVKVELPVFRDTPMAQGYFIDSTIVIPCDVGVEEHITNATNNAFISYESEGVIIQGDSMIVQIEGLYETELSMSFSGSNNTITWTYGLYINDVKVFEKSRTTGNNQVGDVTVPIEFDMSIDDVVKWKITNETNNDDPIITDAIIKCKLTKEIN